MGKMQDKLKNEAREQRMSDPHAWAYEIEKRADHRSLTGAFAFFACIVLGVNVWLLWKERDALIEKVAQLEASMSAISRPEKTDACGNPIPSGIPAPPDGFCLVD